MNALERREAAARKRDWVGNSSMALPLRSNENDI
jgi:hypothetical protein